MTECMDFSVEGTNRGNFVAVLQPFWQNPIASYTSIFAQLKEMQSIPFRMKSFTSMRACMSIRERLTKQLRENNFPFTIIADEATDCHSNQEILSVCLRYVDLSTPSDPHITECRPHLASVGLQVS